MAFRRFVNKYDLEDFAYESEELYDINERKESLIIDIREELKTLRDLEKELIIKKNKYKKWYFSKNPSNETTAKYEEYCNKIDSVDNVVDYLEELLFNLEGE